MAFGLCHCKVKRNKERSHWADFAQEVAWCWLKPWMVCAVGRAEALSLLPVCGSSTKHSVGKTMKKTPPPLWCWARYPSKSEFPQTRWVHFVALEKVWPRVTNSEHGWFWKPNSWRGEKPHSGNVIHSSLPSICSDGERIEIKKQPLQPNSVCLPHLCSSSLSLCLIKAHEWPRDPV